MQSLTPPEIDLPDIKSKFWGCHVDQHHKQHPTMHLNPKFIFQNWLHQNQLETAYSRLHPPKSTFPMSNRNSEEAIVISVKKKSNHAFKSKIYFPKLTSPKSAQGHLHPPKSTFPISNRNSEEAMMISVKRRVQPCIHIEFWFSKFDLDKSHAVLCRHIQ